MKRICGNMICVAESNDRRVSLRSGSKNCPWARNGAAMHVSLFVCISWFLASIFLHRQINAATTFVLIPLSCLLAYRIEGVTGKWKTWGICGLGAVLYSVILYLGSGNWMQPCRGKYDGSFLYNLICLSPLIIFF